MGELLLHLDISSLHPDCFDSVSVLTEYCCTLTMSTARDSDRESRAVVLQCRCDGIGVDRAKVKKQLVECPEVHQNIIRIHHRSLKGSVVYPRRR